MERQLENTGSELRDAQNELGETRRGQRRYVIESLVAKAKGFVLPHDFEFGFSTGFQRSFDAKKGLGFGTKYQTLAAVNPKYSGAPPVTGQKVVVDLFSIPEFDLLKETQRLDLQQEVQEFIGQHPEWFELNLWMRNEIWKTFGDALAEINRLEIAREKMKKIVVVEGEPDRIPNKQDISRAKDAVKAARSTLETDSERAHVSQEAFREGLDEMKRELISVAG